MPVDQMLEGVTDYSQQGDFAGINFSERYFVAVLRNAIKWFKDNPNAWKRILGNIEPDELTRFAAYFEKRLPSVRLGYARASDPMPQINVVLEQESSSTGLIGDLAGVGDMSELSSANETIGGVINTDLRRQVISLHIHADHPEVTLFLYHMAHSSILSSARYFAQKNLFNLSFNSGTEVQPQEVYLPEQIYSRVLTYSFEGVGQGVIPLPPPPASLHIFVQGVKVSDTITGGVKVQITDTI